MPRDQQFRTEKPNVPVVVYIPVYNNVEWCRGFTPTLGFEYVVSDNASTDGSGDVLESKGLTVVRQNRNLGRVGNWEFCIHHFLESDRNWMKLHMAGDEIAPNAPEIFERLINNHPEARFIAASAEVVRDGNHLYTFCPSPRTEFIERLEGIKRVALRCNWVGIPLTTCMHRDALCGDFSFGEFTWVADLRLYLWILRRHAVLCTPELVGRQIIHPNRLHALLEDTFKARSEEGMLRNEAADIYKRLGRCTEAEFDELLEECRFDWETRVMGSTIKTSNKDRQVQMARLFSTAVLIRATMEKLRALILRIVRGRRLVKRARI